MAGCPATDVRTAGRLIRVPGAEDFRPVSGAGGGRFTTSFQRPQKAHGFRGVGGAVEREIRDELFVD
jgi:hypothetical protein